MSKSKSDLLLALSGVLLLGGCDALRTPVPDGSATPIRASFAGFVGEGTNSRITIARPLDDPSEKSLQLPWFDQRGSFIATDEVLASGVRVSQENSFYPGSGLTGSAGLWIPVDAKINRFHGCLRWNASAPFLLSDQELVVDSFELRPQPGTRVRFFRDRVRGDLCLRWPRLASESEANLYRLSRIPDSLKAFLDEWISLSKARGDVAARILLQDTTAAPFPYFLSDPDTSVMRRVLQGESAQIFFSPGDSIWIPFGRSGVILVNLDRSDTLPVLQNHSIWSTSFSSTYLSPSGSGTTKMLARANSPVGFTLRDWGFSLNRTNPVRIVVQIAGTCPAFEDWRRYGSTDRSHRPTGNVAPFDGYLCEIFPDTLSFPRGDIILTPPDTSTQPKVEVKVDSLKFLPAIKTP